MTEFSIHFIVICMALNDTFRHLSWRCVSKWFLMIKMWAPVRPRHWIKISTQTLYHWDDKRLSVLHFCSLESFMWSWTVGWARHECGSCSRTENDPPVSRRALWEIHQSHLVQGARHMCRHHSDRQLGNNANEQLPKSPALIPDL